MTTLQVYTLIIFLGYILFTILSIFTKRKTGKARLKTAISMLFFGSVSVIGLILNLIDYSNASFFQNTDRIEGAMIEVFQTSLQAIYMIGGALYLLKNKKAKLYI